MRLVTIQPYEVLEILQSRGCFVCDISKSNMFDCADDFSFIQAYDWLVQEMVKRIGHPPVGVKYPIWAWYRDGGEDFTDWREEGKIFAKITVDIDPARVVLSEIDDWQLVLSHDPLLTDEEAESEEYDKYWGLYVAAGEEAIRATWPRMFREDGEFLQATFWELYLSDVVDIEVFTSRHIDDELD